MQHQVSVRVDHRFVLVSGFRRRGDDPGRVRSPAGAVAGQARP
jgi:hypothetical protein